jgi:rsbT co-antagonist protein RsbR
MPTPSRLPDIVARHQKDVLQEWIGLQLKSGGRRADLMKEDELREQSRQFLAALAAALQKAGDSDITGAEWGEVRDLLRTLSASRAAQGFTPGETAMFVFTAESYQKTREDVIRRQQEELIELSTPVVKLWEGILAVPLIGTLDSARTQVVMENLLQQIVDTGSGMAIIDITGVPTVDTLVAQHLLKTVAAARLMGADCIISGVRPQIAQTIVHLGVDLGDVVTKPSLAHALALAFKRSGIIVSRAANAV